MRILFKLTTRGRVEKALATIQSIRENCVSDDYFIVCSVDKDDPTAKELFERTEGVLFINGTSKNKIDAINRDVNLIGGWEILVNVSDDQVFIKKGFDEIIRGEFREYDENGGEILPDLDQFIHFPDGNREDLATMSIMGRDYYNRDKYIYHSDYVTECCDDEAQEVAKIRGCYKFVNEQIFYHEHPAYGKGSMDASYELNLQHDKRMKDRETLGRRRAINFEINKKPNMKKLSILIPSITERAESLAKLESELVKQIAECSATEDVEIVKSVDNREKPIGEKRNELQQSATGLYSCFFDDDDWPGSEYISKVLKAIEENKDCCSFTGVITFDGENPELFEHSIKYPEWRTNDTGAIKYERYPNHLNVIKTDIAKKFTFPLKNHGEDHDWSTQIHKSGMIKTEAYIPDVIYHYKFVSKK